MRKLTVPAPAKINLHLRVKGRRPDGFHDLESVFLALAFGDTLHFELLDEKDTLEVAMEWQIRGKRALTGAIPPEENTIFKAVSLFRAKTGFNQGIKARVEKRIPLGGGLGGGSSDGASTLLALNLLASPTSGLLDGDSLAAMGAVLGSDLPFFLHKARAAWVSGRGERVQPLDAPGLPPGLSFVLVNPGFPSETAGAFRRLDAFQPSRPADGSASDAPDARLVEALSAPPHQWPFANDFLPMFLDGSGAGSSSSAATAPATEAAAYRDILSQLREQGAGYAGLSGSGSTCFGAFTERQTAENAACALSRTWDFVECTEPQAERIV